VALLYLYRVQSRDFICAHYTFDFCKKTLDHGHIAPSVDEPSGLLFGAKVGKLLVEYSGHQINTEL
jgi:hypothetical protein